MKEIIYLLRPHHYIKNIFIFAPLLFSFTFRADTIFNAFIAFILFSLITSSIYVFNDLMDIKEDKKHPYKKNRPVASGQVSRQTAIILILAFSLISLLPSALINIHLFIVLGIYFILNILYSVKLKHIALIDIVIIAGGFVLRLFAGSVATGIILSVWIITITFLLALFIALGKRRDDVLLASEGKAIRKNIDGYNLEFINVAMTMMAGVVIVSYILYTISAEVIAKMHTRYLYLTTLFVIIGIMRYMQITFVKQKSGSPIRIVLQDSFLLIIIAGWISSFLLLVLL